jgi:hypothetical protein
MGKCEELVRICAMLGSGLVWGFAKRGLLKGVAKRDFAALVTGLWIVFGSGGLTTLRQKSGLLMPPSWFALRLTCECGSNDAMGHAPCVLLHMREHLGFPQCGVTQSGLHVSRADASGI